MNDFIPEIENLLNNLKSNNKDDMLHKIHKEATVFNRECNKQPGRNKTA